MLLHCCLWFNTSHLILSCKILSMFWFKSSSLWHQERRYNTRNVSTWHWNVSSPSDIVKPVWCVRNIPSEQCCCMQCISSRVESCLSWIIKKGHPLMDFECITDLKKNKKKVFPWTWFRSKIVFVDRPKKNLEIRC